MLKNGLHYKLTGRLVYPDAIMSKETELAKELFTVGAHFGYSRTRRHPSTAKYLFATKNKVDIIDVEQTATLVESTSEVMNELGKGGKTVLFVGTKPEAKKAVEAAAESIGMPFVTTRWIGGFLTNFSEIKKRVNRLLDLRESKENGELQKKYTKKELLLITREMEKMESMFAGIADMKGLPDALVIVDPKKEHIAVAEATRLAIPTIAIASTDCDIDAVDHAIVANDASRASIELLIKRLADAYKQ